MSKRDDEWRANVVRAVAQRQEATGRSPTLGELAAVLGWGGDVSAKRSQLRLVTSKGYLVCTPTLPKRIVVTTLGEKLLEAVEA